MTRLLNAITRAGDTFFFALEPLVRVLGYGLIVFTIAWWGWQLSIVILEHLR